VSRKSLLCYAYERKHPSFAYVATKLHYGATEITQLTSRAALAGRGAGCRIYLARHDNSAYLGVQILRLQIVSGDLKPEQFETVIRDTFDSPQRLTDIKWIGPREEAPTRVLIEIARAVKER